MGYYSETVQCCKWKSVFSARLTVRKELLKHKNWQEEEGETGKQVDFYHGIQHNNTTAPLSNAVQQPLGLNTRAEARKENGNAILLYTNPFAN